MNNQELKQSAEQYKAMQRSIPLNPDSVLKLLAIQAQLVEALEALEDVGALEDGLLGDDPKIIKAQKLARSALAAAGAQP